MPILLNQKLWGRPATCVWQSSPGLLIVTKVWGPLMNRESSWQSHPAGVESVVPNPGCTSDLLSSSINIHVPGAHPCSFWFQRSEVVSRSGTGLWNPPGDVDLVAEQRGRSLSMWMAACGLLPSTVQCSSLHSTFIEPIMCQTHNVPDDLLSNTDYVPGTLFISPTTTQHGGPTTVLQKRAPNLGRSWLPNLGSPPCHSASLGRLGGRQAVGLWEASVFNLQWLILWT